LLSICSKKNSKGHLNFERTPLKPQRAINPDKREREREERGVQTKRNHEQSDFLRQKFWQTRKKKPRPWKAQNQKIIIVGSFEASFGQSTR
jgi:hypothetical protein